MNIGGFQKFSLLDFPEKVSAIVFTSGCNFRCPFCHNPALAHGLDVPFPIGETDVLSFLASRVGRLDGVCVTGGEPLLQNGLPSFLERIKSMGFLIKLDTNGSFPDRLESLLSAHLLDYVAMDIKNSCEKYIDTSGYQSLEMDSIEKSINLLRSGNILYEFRTTLVREFHTESEVLAMARWLNGARRYCLQNFRDTGDLLSPQPLHSFTADEMARFAQLVDPFVQSCVVRT